MFLNANVIRLSDIANIYPILLPARYVNTSDMGICISGFIGSDCDFAMWFDAWSTPLSKVAQNGSIWLGVILADNSCK